MQNYYDGVENTQDYFKGLKTEVLMDFVRMPNQADLTTHLRMVYGHTDWRNLVYKLDDNIINQIMKNKESLCEGKDVLVRMKKGDYVIIVNNYDMGPLTFKGMITDSVCFELYDLNAAIEKAAHFFVDDLLESVFSFSLFTPYFLIAFRLALMDGDMPDDERFEPERLEEVWRKTYSSVLYFAGQKLQHSAIELGKSNHWMSFDLDEYKVDKYMEAMRDEK